jgi:hypothetical protein
VCGGGGGDNGIGTTLLFTTSHISFYMCVILKEEKQGGCFD